MLQVQGLGVIIDAFSCFIKSQGYLLSLKNESQFKYTFEFEKLDLSNSR